MSMRLGRYGIAMFAQTIPILVPLVFSGKAQVLRFNHDYRGQKNMRIELRY